MQAKAASNIKVIDVSHHQGAIDWVSVKADGVQGAFIKASEGRTGVDTKFSTNAKAAVAAGVKVGFYHYAHPENNSALVEAAKFADTVKGYAADFPHVLDVEGDAASVGGGKLSAWCVAWLQEVERLTGHPTMIYTGASFAKSYLGNQLASYPLWIAHYGVSTPMANSTWDKWSVFQYTDVGKVKGISGNVDTNAMEKSFFEKYVVEENEYMLTPEDANAIIKFLSAGYAATVQIPEAKKEFNRLANELRKASGQATQ
ncbi:GH25 family lysozyme M1 (1,4-beta-N-acetylmuramidase) [Paenibacillus cellulosilyticus]|uniref:GH25 family lysozyme M1 (1,4-beta-N-acetylmuramidase) n=1 Tax=Paenibacillus cellulosilyticus TaxID=375489 RepID=A0A2V2YEY6_9BACL|nr:glycoside hydrolase family 25 protein [Paenibacillus cellulosilyticus]PWV90274.1 GH25 family lysozyme M1 (1,4-beta-N-acetylmuramidase) [Paenibacillus cellulosilyticus]QKS43431.1 glycoside hydrolase family 25 protein [Paenibacillus cellulosilyticus]